MRRDIYSSMRTRIQEYEDRQIYSIMRTHGSMRTHTCGSPVGTLAVLTPQVTIHCTLASKACQEQVKHVSKACQQQVKHVSIFQSARSS